MAALTKSVTRDSRNKSIMDGPVKAGVKIYQNAAICTDSSGLVVPAADVAGYVYLGIARYEYDNTGGSNGDIKAEAWTDQQFKMTCTGAAQSWVGKNAYLIDDNTVAISGTTNSILMGKIVGFIDSSNVWVLG
jgi:hypothetical protein